MKSLKEYILESQKIKNNGLIYKIFMESHAGSIITFDSYKEYEEMISIKDCDVPKEFSSLFADFNSLEIKLEDEFLLQIKTTTEYIYYVGFSKETDENKIDKQSPKLENIKDIFEKYTK